MTGLLLDTHAVVWLVQADGPPVPDRVRTAVSEASRVWISAVSALEVSTKVRTGKLPAAAPLVERWSSARRRLGADALEVTEAHALAAGSLPWEHRDPFDRLLVAQARLEGLTLLTADRAVLAAPDVDLLPW